jgi:hypothetical protein
MTIKPTTKTFDCIAYKRKVQEQIYEQTRHMTTEEQIQYFRRRAEEGSLGDWWRKVKAGSKQSRQ